MRREVQAEGFHNDLLAASKTNMWPIKSLLTEVNALFDQNNISVTIYHVQFWGNSRYHSILDFYTLSIDIIIFII